MPSPNLQENSLLLKLADQCVKCGLCLPHCPTYLLAADENESPRGRISLLQGLAEKHLSLDAHLHQHIDTCLLCRNCERVCPAGVQVGQIIDKGRALIHQELKISSATSFLLSLPTRPALLRILNNILWCYQTSGVQWLLRQFNLFAIFKLSKAEQLLPKLQIAKKQRGLYPSEQNNKGRIGLFIGCLGETFELQTTEALKKLLTRLGYDVHIISEQNCCGALAAHVGDEQSSLQLARKNIRAFTELQLDTILYSATGCGIQLLDYSKLPWSNTKDQDRAEQFVSLLEEAMHFLNRNRWSESISFSALNKRVAIHEPCSQANVLRQNDFATGLLQNIPELETELLEGNDQCCGAAGAYMIKHEDQAYAFRKIKVAAVVHANVELVVTTNPGCSLFLGAGLADRGIRVVHPAVLLAEQISPPDVVDGYPDFILPPL